MVYDYNWKRILLLGCRSFVGDIRKIGSSWHFKLFFQHVNTVQCSYKSPKISLQKLNIVVEWSWVRERAVFNSFHSSEIQRSNKREIQQVSLQIYNELKQRNIKEMFESFKFQYCCTAKKECIITQVKPVVDVSDMFNKICVWFSVIYHFGNLSYTFQSIFLPLLSRKETYLAFFLKEIKIEGAAIDVFWYSWLNTGFSREGVHTIVIVFLGGIWVFGDDCKGTETLNWWLSISLLSPISLCRKWICWAFLAAKCHIMEICAILSLRKSTFAKTQKSNIFNLHQSQEM